MASVVDDNAGVAGYYDPEKNALGDNYKICETTPVYIRHDFIRKVFSIVFVQLVLSFGFMLLSYYVTPIRVFLTTFPYIALICLLVFVVISLVISCKPEIVHSRTNSIICLSVMTPLMMVFLATFCGYFKSFEILMAAGLTTASVGVLILFAFQTKYDFTSWVPYVLVAGLVFVVFLIVGIFVRSPVLRLVYAGIGALFASIYILIDVQMIVGGGRKYEYTIDDYCLASIALYTDIVYLFMDILRLVSH